MISKGKYKTTHDSGLLMKTIGSKERTVDEFWAAREKGMYLSYATCLRSLNRL